MRILSTFASLLSPFLDLLFSIICTCLYGRKRVSHIENATLRESACATARKLRRGELSSSAIVEACIARIREVDKVVHAVADEFFAEALHQAAQVDAELERLRKLEGTKGDAELDALFAAKPFYGVPTSIKSCFAVRGARWDVGLLSRLHVRAQYDASEVCRLRAAGFIVLCTSTVPEEVAWLETMSVIRPRTLNPYNSSRGAGGSSGGEAALIAAGGVPVGLGSDSGGSIRIPAAFCGIFGHKPTSDDSTHYGDDVQLGESKGKVHAGPGHYPPVFSRRQKRMLAFGPLCRHAEDLWPTLLASLCEEDRKRVTANGRSPATINWSRTKFLLIPSLAGANGGPSGGDQFVNAPDRLVQEAIDRVVQFVKSELHADVEPLRFQSAEFESLQLVEMIDVFMEYSYLPDCVGVDEREPAAADWRTLDGRPWKSASMLEVHANYDEAHRVSPTRELLKKLLFFLPFKHRITMPILLSGLTESQVCERPHNSHVHSLRRGAEFERAFKHLFATYKQAGYENVVILCAAMPQVAPLHAKPVICSPFDAFYSGIFNVLGLPSSVAPILKDHARGTNLPAGVQIVSDKFDDVVCIAFANLLEQVFGGWREPSAD